MKETKRPARRGRPPKDLARDTRALMLDAALDLFARQGVAGTSVRQIAAAVGLSESALYAHFAGKQAIYDALLAQAGPSAVGAVLAAAEPALLAAPPAVLVPELVRRVYAAWEAPRVRRFMDVFLREGGYGSPVGRRQFVAARAEAQAQLGELFRRWQEAGLVRAEYAPEWLAWELISPVAYLRLLYLHGQATAAERATGRRLAEQHAAFFLAAVLTERTATLPREAGPAGEQREG